jgi:hypothetical protein
VEKEAGDAMKRVFAISFAPALSRIANHSFHSRPVAFRTAEELMVGDLGIEKEE